MSSKLMHTENSPDLAPDSPSTAVTTPEDYADEQNDIWESDSPTNRPAQDEMLSDLPTVKRQRMTDGYREGLSIGKARVMQQGFDDGYPIGVQIALRVGLVMGVLEGYLASKSISQSVEKEAAIQKIYDKAKRELACPALLGNVDDELIAGMTGVPPPIEAIISQWEVLVIGNAK